MSSFSIEAMPASMRLSLCVGLSVIGSLSYVTGIMSIAYPAFLIEKRGQEFSKVANIAFMALYVVGQGGALAFPLIATWFGPVSIQLPVYQASMLLWNKYLMVFLGMEQSMMKDKRAGTEVIVVATVMLMDAGPLAQEVVPDFGFPPTVLWLLFLCGLWVYSLVGMLRDVGLGVALSPNAQMAIYVVAQGIGTSATTTLGKLLAIEKGGAIFVVMALYVAAGATNTISSIIAAGKLNQSDFIPFASVASLALNQLTGLLVWEDWRTIQLWVTYVGIHVLIGLGIYDLANVSHKVFEYAGSATRSIKVLRDYRKLVGIVAYWKRYRSGADSKRNSRIAQQVSAAAQQRKTIASAKPRVVAAGRPGTLL